MTTAVSQKWPMIEIEYHNPKRSRKIISLDEACRRYGLDERERGWLERGEVAGTSVRNKGRRGDAVNMLHRYTLQDSIRDAAPELLSVLKAMNHMGGDERGGYCICPLQDGSAPDAKHATGCANARKAIAKAERTTQS